MLEKTREENWRPRDVIELQSSQSPQSAAGDADARDGRPADAERRPSHDDGGKAAGRSVSKHRPRGDENDDDDDADEGGIWDKLRRHKLAVAVFCACLALVVIAAIVWYLHARHYESTDDAFIDGRPVAISPEVTGNIVDVPVTDNQMVHAGDLLAAIDPRDYRAALQEAEAQIEQASATIASTRAQIDAQKAQVQQAAKQVDQAQANLNFARDQDVRAQELVHKGFGTVQNAQQTSSDLKARQAALDAAVATHAAAERQIEVLQAQVKNAEGQLAHARAQKAAAEANVTRTELHATVDGRVTRLTAAVGAAATPGQALMILVPTHLWVTANFKETQLTNMHPGQPVDIEIDAYGRTYHGHVDSIQAGSGTAFSLLPAENATGNYVKVVQRVPVKLTFDKLPDVEIGPGMSVVPTVQVR